MNKFTKPESMPKTGHVNEVCKEWLVREDGALAYKLQSQEINHFYKGNRFRNAVVREDFPVALHEQIKEKENAEKQAEYYRRKLHEQEEHDKRIAKEIAEKLERDLQEQQQRELLESELMAQQMQEMYVNLPVPPAAAARNKTKPPPRPTKTGFLQQHSAESTNTSPPTTSSKPQQRHQQHINVNFHANGHHNNAGHVLVSDEFSTISSQQQQQQQQQKQQQKQPQASSLSSSSSSCNQFVERSGQAGRFHPALTTDNFPMQQQQYENAQQVMQKQQQQQRHKHLSSVTAATALSASSSSSVAAVAVAAARRNVFDLITSSPNHQPSPTPNLANSPNSPRSPPPPPFAPSTSFAHTNTPIPPSLQHFHNLNHHHSHAHQPPPPPPPLPPAVEEFAEYSDVADSIRRYDIQRRPDSSALPNSTKHVSPSSLPTQKQHNYSPPKTPKTPTSPTPRTPPTPTLASPPTSPPGHNNNTPNTNNFNKILSPSSENLLRADNKFQKLSPEKYDHLVGNDLGVAESLPPEADNRAHQQQQQQQRQQQKDTDDIELYVDPCDYASLREIGLPLEEIKELSKKIKQEQKDEMLARRLQEMETNDGLTQEERDRLLAIEAQDKELAKMLQEREKAKVKRAKEKARQRKSQQRESGHLANGPHCGPPIALPQDGAMVPSVSHDHLLDAEAYANPIDVIKQEQQRLQNGGQVRTSHAHAHDDDDDFAGGGRAADVEDIYTLPVDSCRSVQQQRPASLIIANEAIMGQGSNHNSMTRSENFSLDSHDSLLSAHDGSLPHHMNYNNNNTSGSINSRTGSFDHSSSPTPPYMPIQGTRRPNSGDERKKKSKDKCTHQ